MAAPTATNYTDLATALQSVFSGIAYNGFIKGNPSSVPPNAAGEGWREVDVHWTYGGVDISRSFSYMNGDIEPEAVRNSQIESEVNPWNRIVSDFIADITQMATDAAGMTAPHTNADFLLLREPMLKYKKFFGN
jgi:hypothetical protein